MNTTVEYTHTEHKLRPETHLRPEQGAEFHEQMVGLAKQKAARRSTMSRQEILDRLESLAGSSSGTRGAAESQIAETGVCEIEEGVGVEVASQSVGASSADKGGMTALVAPGVQPKPKRRLRLHRSGSSGRAPATGKRRKHIPDYASLTMVRVLGETIPSLKECLWHQKKRLPGLERSLDKSMYDSEVDRLEALTAAEHLSPTKLPLCSESELDGCIQIISQLEAWPSDLPECFVRELIRKAVVGCVDNVAKICSILWPFGAEVFDALEPQLRGAPVPLCTRLAWMRTWIVKEFLAAHMPKDGAGANLILGFARQLLDDSDRLQRELSEEEHAVWGDIVELLNVLAAYVQAEAVSAQQVEHLSAFCKQEARGEQSLKKLVAKSLERPWWAERVASTWRRASAEAMAQPRLKRVAMALRSPATTPAARDQAWAELEKNMDKWASLRTEVLQELFSAISDGIRAWVARVADSELPDVPLAEVEACGGRLEWLSSTPAAAGIPDAAALTATLRQASARGRVAHGTTLISRFVSSETDADDKVGLLQQMQDAFAECNGLYVKPNESPLVFLALEQIAGMQGLAAKHVDVCLNMLSLLPIDAERPNSDNRVREWDTRLAKSKSAWALKEALANAPFDTANAARAAYALEKWGEHLATTECVPPTLGEEGNLAAGQVRVEIGAFATRSVESARQSLGEALPRLEAVAGGMPETSGSWKAKLSDTTEWSEVVAAANLYLLSGENVKDRVKNPHKGVVSALESYKEAVAQASVIDTTFKGELDAGVTDRCCKAMELCLVTTAEAYFVEVLTIENKRKIPEKLRARIASMTKKEIDSELLLRQIWDKVQQNLA